MEEDIENNNEEMGTKNANASQKAFKDMSPEEVRERAKQTTAKVTASASGAVEGYVQNSEPEVLKDAASKASESVRTVASTVKENLPESMRNRAKDAADTGAGRGGFGGSEGSFGGGLSSEGTAAADQAGILSRAGGQIAQKAGDLKDRAADKSRDVYQGARQAIREKSADELRTQSRNAVGRATAAVHGAAAGYAEQADPKLLKDATQKTADAAKSVIEGVKGGASAPAEPSSDADDLE